MKRNATVKKLILSILLIALLSAALATTTFALAYSMVRVEENRFTTGIIKIALNDTDGDGIGEPLIGKGEFLFEPGMTVKKDFLVENQGSCDVYCRFYFQNVSGGLADHMEVTICNGETVLAKGTPKELTKDKVFAVDEPLAQGEKRTLQIYFRFPAQVGNEAQDLFLSFDFAVDAVQTKNNPDKDFE